MDSSEPIGRAAAADATPAHGPAQRLEELQRARRAHEATLRARARSAPRTRAVPLAAGTGALVGIMVALLGGFEYAGTADLRLSGTVNEEKLDVFRRSLVAHAAENLPDAGGEVTRWQVHARGENRLALTGAGGSDIGGIVRQCAAGFVEHLTQEAERARTTPGEAERIMAEYAERLRTRWQAAESDLEQAIAALPGSDPRESRAAMMDRWRQMRDSFTIVRARLVAAKQNVDTLSASDAPTEGVVDPQEREAALLADAALQQDLKELEVRLTDLKLAALTAWQESARHLEETLAQSARWEIETSPGKEDDARVRATRFTAEVRRYHEDLTAFSSRWNQNFTTLQSEPCDPRSESILELHQKARTFLGDFLFQASERFSSMRSHVQTMNEGLDGGARHHVLQSEVVRRFTTLQDAHHRFEFAAGMIEPADNFRLDSALRSARGLRRRSQDAIGEVDTRLAAAAREKARADRLQRIALAEDELRSARTLADDTVDDIVGMQEELNLTTGMTETFLRAVVRKDAAGSLTEMALRDFTTTEEMVLALRAKRLAAADETKVALVGVDAPAYPANLSRLVRNAGIGFAATFAVVLLGLTRLQKS